jgi:hypothetical protein
LVEHDLAKVGVAGSSPVFRSQSSLRFRREDFFSSSIAFSLVVELVDTQDLKSCSQQCECGFKSRPGNKEKPVHCEQAFLLNDFTKVIAQIGFGAGPDAALASLDADSKARLHSSPVFRSQSSLRFRREDFFSSSIAFSLVVELVDTQDLKSCSQQCGCGFKSRLSADRQARGTKKPA